jgi:spermidine/putrescine transport system permease protein
MNRWVSRSYLGSMYFLLYLPIVVLVLFSFNHSLYSGLWHGATLHWYAVLFHDPALLNIASHSLIIAFLASTIATGIGLLGAVALFKYCFFGKRPLSLMIVVMVVIPDLVLGIALLILFHALHMALGFYSLLLAHITFCIPFVVMTIMGRLSGTNKHLFEAAKDLGAKDAMIFSRIILPLMMPGIIAGWLLSFTLSFDDVIISSFVAGPSYQILPLYIFSQVKLGITPELNALSTLLLIFTAVLVGVFAWVLRRAKYA